MKKVFYVIIIAALAVSCLGSGPSTRQKYTLDVDFEYVDNLFLTDSVRFDNEHGVGIGYVDFVFYHKLNPDKTKVLGGFAVSRLKGSGYEQGRNDFRVNSGRGLNGSPTYAVFKYDKTGAGMPAHDVEFMNLSYGTCGILGFYVNNTAEVVDSVKANFVDGDRLTLKAVGYLNGAKTGEAQINLAEYTTQKDSIIVNWTPFDLYKLGQVQYVEFEMISTKENVPTSFCMDDMLASIVLEY